MHYTDSTDILKRTLTLSNQHPVSILHAVGGMTKVALKHG